MLLGSFLYVLVFQDGRHFKVGVSSNNLERVKKLDAIYQIDHSKSFIVKSRKNGFIRLLEREFLLLFEADEIDFFKSEGYSEIRNVKYIPDIIDILKSKHHSWGIRVQELNSILEKDLALVVMSERKKNVRTYVPRFLEMDQIAVVQNLVKDVVDSLALSITSISCCEDLDGIRFYTTISIDPYFIGTDGSLIHAKFGPLEWTYHLNERSGSTKQVGLLDFSCYPHTGLIECSFNFPDINSLQIYKIVSHVLKVEILHDGDSERHLRYFLVALQRKFFQINDQL